VVGSSYPGAEAGPKGPAVRRLIRIRELGSIRRKAVWTPIYHWRSMFEGSRP